MKDYAEKDIPMELTFEYNCINLPVCPICQEPIYSLQRYHFCHFCGQLFKIIRKD